MRLYYTSGVCSLAVRIILNELNVSCEYESVNLKSKQTETGKDYLSINLKGSVPALLLDNQELLTENAVILQYLADTAHADHLLAKVGTMQRYRTLEWLNFVSTDLHRYAAPLFWSRFSDEVKQTIFTPILMNKLKIVDQHLQDHVFLMGDSMTIADSYLFVILIWLAKLKVDMATWPNLIRYFKTMKQRESIKEALRQENLTELANI